MPNLPKLSPEIIKTYQDEIAKSSSPATAKRKMVSLNRFFDWAQESGHIPENPMAMDPPVQPNSSSDPIVVNTRKKNKVSGSTWAILGLTGGIVVIIFLLLAKLKFPIPFTINFAQESNIQTISTLPSPVASPNSNSANSAVIGAWNLYAKLKLTSETGTPQVGTQTLSFKIYNAPNGGSALYTSDPQSVTTDSNGSTLISLVGVPTNLFFQNDKLYLEPQIQGQPAPSQRILVPTANVASNLNEYPPANPDTGAAPLTIPVIDANGSLNLAGQSPAVTAKEGNLLVSGQVVTIKTADGSGGNIEINPDANGYAHFLFEGNNSNFLNAQAPNLTTGSLYYGMVPNNATGYDLIKLQSGAPSMTTRFSVDALGNTYTGGNLNVNGDVATAGTDRVTSTGALENITGYSQNSGNFVINQNPGDFAAVTKKITSGTALSDVMTLTLDERGKPATSDSTYSTLVLNRYDGAKEAMALLVKNGNAQFNGQVRLGNFSSLPSAVGSGSIIYNSSDNQVYFWNGTSWVPVGTASSIPFSGITSGTNTSAAMVVGTGASLTYSGTGTINASSLNSLTSSQFLRSDTSTNFTSGTLTTNAGTTLNIAGGLQANGSAGTAGQFLTSGGAGNPPTWDNIASHLTAGADISITGTTNATIADTSTLNSVTGRGATTSNAVQVGNLTSTGTTTFGGITYTWPGSQTNGYVLSTNGSGTLSWSDPNALVSATQFWNQALGALFPKNSSVDLLVGSSSTSSAKFAFTGVSSGLPTASIAGDIANVATYLTGDGTLSATNAQGLTLGSASTGNVVINSRGSNALTANGANLTTTGTFTFPNTNTLTGVASYLQLSQGLSVGGGTSFFFNSSGNLNANAGTFNSTVTLPNANTLTGVANFTELNNGLSVGGATTYYFDKTGNINANNITGVVLNATTSVNTGAGAGTGRIDASGNLTNIGTTQLNGITYTWPASQTPNFVLQTNGSGTLSWVDPAIAVSSSIYWTEGSGALFPKNNSVDVLIGSNATTSAKFAFTGVNSGTPTASIAGTAANVSTFIDGNGNISTTNRNNLTLGNSSTYNSTGNILLNPSGTGNVGIGATSPTSKLSLADSIIDTGNTINATSSAVTSGNILNLGEGGTQSFTGNVLQADIQNGGGASFTGNFLNFLNAGSLKFKVDFSGNIATAGNAAINGGSVTTTAATANVFNSAATLNLGTTSTAVNIGAGTGTTTVNNDLSVKGNTTLGTTSSNTVTFNANVASNIVPASTNTYNLGTSASVEWNNIYAKSFVQNGNLVCDASGTNCPSGAGLWALTAGALYPTSSTADLLVGSSSTSSAKFAFTGVDGGIPTATIAGSVANVAAFIDGNGNISTTNRANLTLGNSSTYNSTGNILLSPNGTGYVGIGMTSPTNKLSIGADLGATSVPNSTIALGNSSGNSIFTIGQDNSDRARLLWNYNATPANAYAVLGDATGTHNLILQDAGGNVGITTTSPTAKLDVNGSASVSGTLTFRAGTGTIQSTTFSPLVVGGSTTGNITLNPSNAAAGGYVAPNTNAVTDLGTSSLAFRNIYGTTLYTGGTARLDSSGNLTNIGTTQLHGITYTWPAADAAVSGYVLSSNGAGTLSWIAQTGGGGSNWTLAANGVLYPNSQTADILFGGTATNSAKFAFTGVDGGLPTASISGNIANVATYLTGDGNLATTNMQDLTLGGSTTGQVILNSRGSNALIANGLNLTAGGTITLPNSNTLTGVASYLQNSQGYSVGGGTTYHFDSSGNIVANNVAVNGGSLTTTAGTLNAFTANATVINFGINGSGSVNIGGGSASNGCTFNDANGTLTCAGNFNSLASSGTNGWWQLNNKVLSPSNSTYDLTVGGSATGSAFQAFGIENATGDIAKLNSTVITTGNVFEATASAITSGNIIKLGQGGNTSFTGNTIFADMDNTGQGGIGFTGNFLKFNNAGTTEFTLNSAGNLDAMGTASISGSLTFKAGTGTIQTTTFSPLVIGGATTGNISLNPSNSLGFVGINKSSPLFNLDVNGSASISGTLSLAPMVQGTAGTCNASSAGKEYYDGVANQYYFCNGTAWTAIGSGSGTNFWQLNNKILSPANSTYDLAIGGTATGSAFQVFGSETPTSGLEALNSTVTTTGNILSATSSAITSGNIFNLGQGGTANFTGSGLAMNFGVGGGGSFTGNFLNLKNNGTAKFTVDASGNVSGAGALQIGAGTNTVAYSRIGTSTDNGHFGTPVLGDLLVSGRSEFVGNMYLDNGTTGSFTISDYQGTGAIIFPALPTSDFHTLSAGSWKVDNTQNIGKAAFVVNQSSTVNDIFDASSGGTLRFSIANNGDTVVGNTGLGKITVGTVDPPYTINGQKYATYLPGITGVKEETTGIAPTNEYVPGKGYRSVIDFNSPTVGSDLWVFSKATDIKDNINSLVALLTPSDDTRTWYEVDSANKKIAIYSTRPTSISYRLTAPRFDAADHPNSRADGAQGFILNIPDVINNNAIATTIQNISDYVITSIGNGVYSLKDSSGTVIDGIESIGNFVTANIRAGSAQTVELLTDKLSATVGTVNQLISSSVQTSLISPIPGGTDVNIQVGTASQSGKLAIQNASGTQVASIDDQGNATFSGTVKSRNIDAIQNLLTQVSTDQSVLSQIVNAQISTSSANLSNLITSDLYVTNQAAVNSLSVTKNVAVGTDLIISSSVNQSGSSPVNSIDTLSAPLKIQSLAMAPVEIMAGLVKIDTKGNVNIAGDLAVAGRVKASGLTLTEQSTSSSVDQSASTSASLLTLQDSAGSSVATVDASGSAVFNSLATGGLTIAGASVASSSALVNGTITTNSTVGSAVIPAGVTEITIKNPKVTDYTLVYVTPTSSTQNNVLYIKSKQAGQFTLGFDRPVPQDVTFNWWIVQVSQ